MNISRVSPDFAAQNLLEVLNVKAPADLRDLEVLAYYRDALVRYARLDGAEARLSVAGRRAIITVSDEVQNFHRRRFSIAHELGHLEMHRYSSSISICTSQDLNQWDASAQNLEQEANAFAAAFLLPQSMFAPLCGLDDPSLDVVSQLANKFWTSLTATAIRYVRFCPEPVAIVYSQGGRIKWFVRSATFEELHVFIEKNVRLDPLSRAAHLREGKQTHPPKAVPVSAWLANGRHKDNAEIMEHSLFIEAYGAVLTLLWVNDDIFDDDEYLW